VLLWSSGVFAQTYNSGSTGADGPLNPASNTTLALPADGVLNFTTVDIPSGVTVTFTPNSANTSVTLLATGDVTIAGTISVDGSNGIANATSGPIFNPGGAGGPGGFAGGAGGARGSTNNAGSTGQGPGGGAGSGVGNGAAGSYGAPTSFISLLPLFGGSGGGGSVGDSTQSGSSGGGGGGAVVIASSTKITLTGSVTANGAPGGAVGCTSHIGGGGSGGAIRLVAPQIDGNGTLQAIGAGSCFPGGAGRIHLEAFTLSFAGTGNPVVSTSVSPGPVTASSNPALIDLPTLTISMVDNVTSPVNPSGSYATADVTLAQGTTNPVTVTLGAANIPVGTVFTVKLIPQFAAATTVTSTASTGTFSSSTATASVTFPSGQVSVLNAYGSFTLPAQIAALYPLIDGEPVERILLAANYGGPTTVTLITHSGKQMKVGQM
jgi:hypothetical protein